MEKIAGLGWPVGVRIDPLIDCVDFEGRYRTLFDKLFANLPPDSVHSVSLGAFRVPVSYFKKMEKLYPEEPLFAGKFEKRGNFTGYRQEVEQDRSAFCRDELLKRIGEVPSLRDQPAPFDIIAGASAFAAAFFLVRLA